MMLSNKVPVLTVLLTVNIFTGVSSGMLNLPDMNPSPEPIPAPGTNMAELANLLQSIPPTVVSPNAIPGSASSNYPKNVQDAIQLIRSFMSSPGQVSANENANQDQTQSTMSQTPSNNVTPGPNTAQQPRTTSDATPPAGSSGQGNIGNTVAANGNDQPNSQSSPIFTTAANTQIGQRVDVPSGFVVLPNAQSVEIANANGGAEQMGSLVVNLAMQPTNTFQQASGAANGMSLASVQNPSNKEYGNVMVLQQPSVGNSLTQHQAQQRSMAPMMQLQGQISTLNLTPSQSGNGGMILNNAVSNSVPNQGNAPVNAPCPFAHINQTPQQTQGQINQVMNSNSANRQPQQQITQVPNQIAFGIASSQSGGQSGNQPGRSVSQSGSQDQTNSAQPQMVNMFPGANMINTQDSRISSNNVNPRVNLPNQFISGFRQQGSQGQGAAPGGINSGDSSKNQMTMAQTGNVNPQQQQGNQGFLPSNNIQNMQFVQGQFQNAPQGFQQAQTPNPQLNTFQPMIGGGRQPSMSGTSPGNQGPPNESAMRQQVQQPSMNQGSQLRAVGSRSQSGTSSGTSHIFRTPQGQLIRYFSASPNQPNPPFTQIMPGTSNSVQPMRTSGQSQMNNPSYNQQNVIRQTNQISSNANQNRFQGQYIPQNNPMTRNSQQSTNTQQLPQTNVQSTGQNLNQNRQGLVFALAQAPASVGNQNRPSSFTAQGSRPNTVQQNIQTTNSRSIPGRVNTNTGQIVSAKGIGQDSSSNINAQNNLIRQNLMNTNPNQRQVFSQIPAPQFNGINTPISQMSNQRQTSPQGTYRQVAPGNNNFVSGGMMNPQTSRMMLNNGNPQQVRSPQLNRPPMLQNRGQFNGR